MIQSDECARSSSIRGFGVVFPFTESGSVGNPAGSEKHAGIVTPREAPRLVQRGRLAFVTVALLRIGAACIRACEYLAPDASISTRDLHIHLDALNPSDGSDTQIEVSMYLCATCVVERRW